MNTPPPGELRLALPAGHMQKAVVDLLQAAGIRLTGAQRSYRPQASVAGLEVKRLKPQNVVGMLHSGSRDIGFAGADWAAETGAELVELLDTGLDPVRVVAAAPEGLLEDGRLPDRELVVVSEYPELTRRWIEGRGLRAGFVHSYGATEVFPPEDGDVIVDNTATGSTLRANGLVICDELMRSSTRLYANPRSLEDPDLRARIEDFVLLVSSVLEARRRVMVEVNVPNEALDDVLEAMPCMRRPTLSPLALDEGYAVKAAVPREVLPTLIPSLRQRGGTDIVVSPVAQIVP